MAMDAVGSDVFHRAVGRPQWDAVGDLGGCGAVRIRAHHQAQHRRDQLADAGVTGGRSNASLFILSNAIDAPV
jgi:hypothetical protein